MCYILSKYGHQQFLCIWPLFEAPINILQKALSFLPNIKKECCSKQAITDMHMHMVKVRYTKAAAAIFIMYALSSGSITKTSVPMYLSQCSQRWCSEGKNKTSPPNRTDPECASQISQI